MRSIAAATVGALLALAAPHTARADDAKRALTYDEMSAFATPILTPPPPIARPTTGELAALFVIGGVLDTGAAVGIALALEHYRGAERHDPMFGGIVAASALGAVAGTTSIISGALLAAVGPRLPPLAPTASITPVPGGAVVGLRVSF
jgi:hypothetical protein